MPLQSMTGFGRCEIERDGRRMNVEIKTVNSRFLEASIRLPRVLSALEETARGRIRARLARGRCDVFIHYQNLRSDSREATVDEGLLAAYLTAYRKIADMGGLPNDATAGLLARMPDVLTISDAQEDEEALQALLCDTVDGAVDNLVQMRTVEGGKLAEDIEGRLQEMERHLSMVEGRADLVVAEYRDRLYARIAELTEGKAPVDEARLATEVALFADRCAIDEEVVRLRSHISGCRDMLQEAKPVGRNLDFLVQEFNREVNTICSKSSDLTITQAGLAMKNEVEKIREQVQNIE